MSAPYSCLNIIKSFAKDLRSTDSIKLSEAQEAISRRAGFASFHELIAISKRNPMEKRLMAEALGVSDLKEVVYENDVLSELETILESDLSGEIASTNACCFTIEDLEVIDASYDDSIGQANLHVAFAWQGEQDPDRPYSGTTFYIEGVLVLMRRNREWSIAREDGFVITSFESDQDRDYEAERKYEEQEYLRLQEQGAI